MALCINFSNDRTARMFSQQALNPENIAAREYTARAIPRRHQTLAGRDLELSHKDIIYAGQYVGLAHAEVTAKPFPNATIHWT